MSKFTTFHDGTRFRAETNPLRGTVFIVCKASGRSAYLRRDAVCKLDTALLDGWNKFGWNADGDDVWQWIWLNCGFHRFAGEAA